ncbi:MAG: hypothetical protein GY791_19675 [Alphaproteobacteria bacterium]|nr:hypothetical protein [Alphaproteobacteria bacterium]
MISLDALTQYLRSCVADHHILSLAGSEEELAKAVETGNGKTTVPMKMDLRLGLVVFQAAIGVVRHAAPDTLPIETRANGARFVLMHLFDLGDETASQIATTLLNRSHEINEEIEAKMDTDAEAELDDDSQVEAFAVGHYLSQEFLAAYQPGQDPPRASDKVRNAIDDLLARSDPG